MPPSKARTVQDPECSAQKDARVHETHQAVLCLYNFHRDKSEPASQLHWRKGEIGTLRQFARSLRQQQLQEVSVRVLEERLRNLTDKVKPNSKYSLLGRTLGAFGDPAWQTQLQLLQLDQHLRRSPMEYMEIAKQPAAKGLPQPHLLSTVETELGRMILSMEADLLLPVVWLSPCTPWGYGGDADPAGVAGAVSAKLDPQRPQAFVPRGCTCCWASLCLSGS